MTNPAVTATGGPDDGEYYIDPKTHKAILHYKRPEEREYFRWLNHMYNEGLLDKDTFVQKVISISPKSPQAVSSDSLIRNGTIKMPKMRSRQQVRMNSLTPIFQSL